MIRYKFPLGADMVMAAPRTTTTIDPALLQQVIRRTSGATFKLLTPTTTVTTPKLVIGDELVAAPDTIPDLPAVDPKVEPLPDLPPADEDPKVEEIEETLPPLPLPPPEAPAIARRAIYQGGISVPYRGVPAPDLLPVDLPPDAEAPEEVPVNTLLLTGAAVLIAYMVFK